MLGVSACSLGAQGLPERPAAQRLAALPEVVISGSRHEQDPDELPMSLDVLGRQDLERRQVRDIRDVAREVPGLSVSRAPARFTLASSSTGRDQNAGFNIRGLDGNRVLMMVDGIRQPRSYVFSANAFGRDYMALGLIERVEVLKGPTSALYGSDGLAGLVNFITLDPSSLLRDGQTLGGRASLAYASEDRGWHAGAILAGRPNEVLQWLLGVNTSGARALQNMGRNASAHVERTEPNPEQQKGEGLLLKAVLTPGGGQRHTLSLEHVRKQADYTLLSAVAKTPTSSTSTVYASSWTELQRDRLSWDARWQPGWAWAQELRTLLSFQEARSREFAFEDRYTAADRERDVRYTERTWQAGLQASRLYTEGERSHRFTYGVDWVRTSVLNLQTGVTPAAGETFPLKRFPDTVETSQALYLQDEVIQGPWSLTAALRAEHFRLQAEQAGFSPPSSTPAASLSGSATSPKLGLMRQLSPQWSLFGHYAAGFRAPNAGQVNAYFENLTQYYKSIPNPNLKPETSQNLELGLRGRLADWRLDAALFTGFYKDFIEDQHLVGGRMTAADPLIYQSVNIGRVRLSGLEFKGEKDWGVWAGGRLASPFGYSRVTGKDTLTNRPINSIDPQRFTAGLRYERSDWSARLDLQHRSAKKASDVDSTQLSAQFLPPSSTTLDLSGQWRLRRDLRLNVALNNLSNQRVWYWSDVRGLSSASTVKDAYTQPGRSLRVALVADF